MKVIITKQEVLDSLRQQYNLDKSVEIEIIEIDAPANNSKVWSLVPKDWFVGVAPTNANIPVEVMFNDMSTATGFSDQWTENWNQRQSHRIVKYRIF